MYVRGEGTVVRLTQVVAGELRDLEDYFGDLQETRMVELRCSETLADNLKIEVNNSHNDSKRRTVPFYIVEYDDAGDEFCVWRSDGKWGLGEEVVQAWCETLCSRSGEDGGKAVAAPDWRHCEKIAAKVRGHPRQAVIESCLDRYRIDWAAVDCSVFWSILGKQGNGDDEEFGNLVLLALLKTELARNKQSVRAQLRRFCHRHAAQSRKQSRKGSLESISEISEDVGTETGTDTATGGDDSPSSSRMQSLSPSYTPSAMPAHAQSPVNSTPPRSMEEFEIDTSKQIMDNFNMLFKPIVENFEDVYLDKYSKHPRRRRKSRHRVSK